MSTPTDKVAVATKVFNPGQVGVVSTDQAIFWHSTDGVTWQWIDLRPVLGDVSSEFGLSALNGGFIAFGEVLPPNDPLHGVATGVVLSSPDGVTWTETASLPRPFSVHPYRLEVVGSNLLLAGAEYICDNGVGDFAAAAHNQQIRYWRSADQGVTWAEVPIESISAIKDPPTPADLAGCAAQPTTDANAYFTREPTTAIIDGRISLFAFDGGSLSTSTDLTTWSTVTLPDAIPADPKALQIPVAESLLKSGDNIVALRLTRGFDARTLSSIGTGYVVSAWTSTDGSTFTKLPPGRPLDIDSDLPAADGPVGFRLGGGAFQVVGNGIELDVGQAAGSYFQPEIAYRSVAGMLDDWQHCVVKPGAFCRFAVLDSTSFAGADLTGIDLAHGQLGAADFTGANLTTANLSYAAGLIMKLANAKLVNVKAEGANLSGADFTGADLTGADLNGAALNASVFTATVTGASFTGALVTLTAPGETGLKFTGIDLTRVRFYGQTALVPLTAADFTGATLVGTSFNKVDLTGAVFTGDDLTSVSFSDVTCPDGQPSDSTQVAAAACRL